ncbi:MAG: CHAT domain-containing protein, partial [Nitrospinae bacterium]|nr:CHAT domain-containing protein [Nitrospinota bacterium]
VLVHALDNLKQEHGWVKKSIRRFRDALILLEQSDLPREPYESALRQNLELTHRLVGSPRLTGSPSPAQEKTYPVGRQWQFRYLEALTAQGEARLKLLLEAERLLSRRPPQADSAESGLLGMQEDLYLAISSELFRKGKFPESLHFSEKGHQQLLLRLRPEPKFSDEDRVAYQEELSNYARQVNAAESDEEADALIEEYAEFLEMAREDDPKLVSLFAVDVPMIEEIQSLLRDGEILIKFQRSRDAILVWEVRTESVRGGSIPLTARLTATLKRLGREGGKAGKPDIDYLSQVLLAPIKEVLSKTQSLILLADGELEFLPWAALRIGGRTLVESVSLTFLSSLAQYRSAESLKNLYNSRFLAVEASIPDSALHAFASTRPLSGPDARLDSFKMHWPNYGVVHIGSPVRLIRHDPSVSFVNLTRSTRRFERLQLSDLFSDPIDAHFIALTDVSVEFHPETNLSPTALLIEGLTFKGYPGVLLRTGPFDAEIHKEFMERFYAGFRKMNPGEALRRTQLELAKRHPESFAWAGYRYYGVPGMSDEEKNAFAEEHFRANAKKGADAFKARDWAVAIDRFEKALVLLDYLDNKTFTEKIYKTLSQAAYNDGDYAKAIRYQKAVFPFVRKKDDPEELAQAYYFLGILYSRAEDYGASVESLNQALKIYKENEVLDQLAESYSTLGIVEENALDYGSALEAFNASMEISEEIGEDFNRGRELRRIGRIYYLRLNQYRAARKYFAEAETLFAELKQPEQRVESLLELGLVSEKEGDFPVALGFYEKAQALAEKSDLKPGLAKALLYQANSHWFQGNYQQAFRFQKEAWSIAESIGDLRQQAFIQNTLGLIYWTLNDSTRALTHLRRSLKLAEKVESVLDVATAYNNIGLVHRKDKHYEKSIEFFNMALERDLQLKSKWGQGYTHRNLGMSYLRMGKTDVAETHIRRAVALSREIGNRTNLVKSMLELGNLALQRGQWKDAAVLFSETRDMAGRLNVLEVLWRALRGEGFALVKSGDRKQAVGVYKKAVAVVDRMRAAIKVEEFQNGFLTDKQDVYKELILLLLDTGKVEESFEFAERAKSRSFIDLLGNQKIDLKNDVSQKLYDRLTAQKQSIRTTEEAVGAARAKGDEAEAKRLAGELVEARNRYQDLLIEAKEQNPEISSFVTVESIALPELYELLDESVGLVEYLVTKNELVAWVVTKGNIEVRRTPVTEAELNATVKDYRDRIQNLAPLEDQARKLYGWLVAPVEPLVEKKRVVGIIPHGLLHYISFASLTDGESYWIERHPLFYSPSASVLKYTFARKFEKGEVTKVLALGNPDLGDFNYDLPLAELEALAIKWNFPEVDVFTRGEARESWLKEHISEYQIIHISSHGEFDPVNPLFSSLKLTRDDAADGNLEVNEIFALDIKADLVTLSACQTGLGEITGGDELVGLNRAFIYAGTHAILSSLWRVSDISTAILIKHFYRNYADNNKAESLRKAQLLVKRLYPHPSYWSGFNLTGDYR